jgi:hypothetical protein
MGLRTDIENAFLKSMFPDKNPADLSDEEKGNIPTLAVDLTEAVKRFLSEQTWEITEMKAFVELEDFVWEDPLPVDVSPNTLAGPYSPVISAVRSLSGVNLTSPIKKAAQSVSEGGAETQPINLEKTEGLKSIGHAYIGNPPEGPSRTEEFDTKSEGDGWNQYAKVKINYNDIEADE